MANMVCFCRQLKVDNDNKGYVYSRIVRVSTTALLHLFSSIALLNAVGITEFWTLYATSIGENGTIAAIYEHLYPWMDNNWEFWENELSFIIVLCPSQNARTKKQ